MFSYHFVPLCEDTWPQLLSDILHFCIILFLFIDDLDVSPQHMLDHALFFIE